MAEEIDWYSGISVAKDPDAVLNYSLDFTDWLETGDSLQSQSVDGGGLTIAASAVDGNKVTFTLLGGTAGQEYTVRVRVTTVNALTDDFSLTFQVNEK